MANTPFRALRLNWLFGLWPLLMWLILKDVVGVSDRYLPHPWDVVQAAKHQGFGLVIHATHTGMRTLGGFILGVGIGIFAGILLYRLAWLRRTLLPFLYSVRSVPSTALVPFFLLWFGFSEIGRQLLLITGIAFNLAIAVLQALESIPERFKTAFQSFGLLRNHLSNNLIWGFAVDGLLPTLRFSLATVAGLGVLSEYLGAQSGLGYLMQSARTTYALDVLVLCAIVIGFMAVLLDYFVCYVWRRLVPWQSDVRY